MKKVFSSLLLVFSIPLSLLKKTKWDNFVGGLIFGAVFSLVVNVATVQVQQTIDKQRTLEALEAEILFHGLTANNVMKENSQQVADRKRPNYFRVASYYPDDVWKNSDVVNYIMEIDPKVQAMLEPSVPKDKRLDISIALYLTSLHTELQLEIAEEVIRKGLKLKEARFHARKVAQRAGIQAGVAKRGRLPHDDYRILQRFAVNFSKEASMFLEMPHDSFESMFKKRDPKERAALIQHFEQGIAQLKKLLGVLARIK